MGVAPTGKAIEIMNISLDQVEEGKVVEHFGVSDWLRALIVFEIDSLGGLKISDDQTLPPLVRRIREAKVPIAVHVGPRAARAEGLVLYMARRRSGEASGGVCCSNLRVESRVSFRWVRHACPTFSQRKE